MSARLTTRRYRRLILAALGVAACFAPVDARADVLSDVNTVRVAICRGERPRAALRLSAELNRAAEGVARGATPQDALLAAGYGAARATALDLQGVADDAQLEDLLGRYCSVIADPEFNQIGISSKREHLWLVLAVERGVPGDAGNVSARVLSLVNEARSRPRRCGAQSFPAARPLRLNPQLERAALLHSQEMAGHSAMKHEGRDGSSPSERVTRTGYRWSTVGENVAAGQRTADEVVAGWLASAGHCENIMNGQFTELGIASAVNAKDRYGVYWTMSLAAPR